MKMMNHTEGGCWRCSCPMGGYATLDRDGRGGGKWSRGGWESYWCLLKSLPRWCQLLRVWHHLYCLPPCSLGFRVNVLETK